MCIRDSFWDSNFFFWWINYSSLQSSSFSSSIRSPRCQASVTNPKAGTAFPDWRLPPGRSAPLLVWPRGRWLLKGSIRTRHHGRRRLVNILVRWVKGSQQFISYIHDIRWLGPSCPQRPDRQTDRQTDGDEKSGMKLVGRIEKEKTILTAVG